MAKLYVDTGIEDQSIIQDRSVSQHQSVSEEQQAMHRTIIEGLTSGARASDADDRRALAVQLANRRTRDRQRVDGALTELPKLMGDGAVTARSSPNMNSPLLSALRHVCAYEKIELPETLPQPDTDDAQLALQTCLRGVGVRSRRISLTTGWEHADGPSFVGFDRDSGAPVAIVRQGPGRFVLLAHGNGAKKPVTEDLAATLGYDGFVLYRALPHRALGAWDLVRHVLASPARRDMQWAGGLALMAAMLGLLTPLLSGRLINEVIPYAETERLTHFAIGLAMLAVGTATFQFVRSIALMRVEAFADGALQAAVWDRLLRLKLSFFRQYEVGDLLIKAMAPTQLRQALSDTAASSALAAIFSVVNFVLMMTYNATLAWSALAFTIVSGAILLGLSYWQLRYERRLLKTNGKVSSFTLQTLFAIRKIRLAGAENRAFVRWLDVFADKRRETYRAATVSNITATLNGSLPVLASILFFSIVGFGAGKIPVGDFIAFNMAFGQFQGAMLALVGAISQSLSVGPIYANMKPILLAEPEVEPERKAPGALSGRIELNNVSFRYGEDGPLILNDVSLSVAPGSFVALVGPSGSGKSTLFRMLLGFETPLSGAVAYDGLDLAHLDLKAVRRQIGVVLQRGTILPGSIYENIVGTGSLTMDDAWAAARMAGFEDDVNAMPMGMHTVLSEGGGGLSGGQRQRLMIARAIVRKPKILLMDEATSALDNRTQATVSHSLDTLDATRVVIAHRLSTVVNADKIIVVDKGQVVQAGTYAELIAQDGVFQDIARPQLVEEGGLAASVEIASRMPDDPARHKV